VERIILSLNSRQAGVRKGARLGDLLEELPVENPSRVVGAYVNGGFVDLHTPVTSSGELKPVYADSDQGLAVIRHSAAHVLAGAVRHLYPGVKLAIGPAIKDGYYYDFEFPGPVTPEDLPAIEQEMKRIVEQDQRFTRFTREKDEAIRFFQEQGEGYKVELIRNLDDGQQISFYQNGDFVDLCRGPHLPSTGFVRAFKLLSLAGAYWRGDERNPMLTRIYGTAFYSQKALREYLKRIEEAKKRDHRRLGRELELFSMHEEGPGFVFWLPRGMVVKNALLDYWREEHTRDGYVEIQTPIILKKDLWEQSGHWDNYRENMYITEIDQYPYAIKPMNCPGGMLVYKEKIRSYRDLPLRVAELGLVHRHEKSGVLQGLFRVRSFTQDDAHIYMLPEQIEEEILRVIRLTDRIYSVFGFTYHLELSTRPEKSIGTDEQWEQATAGLENALKASGKDYRINRGEGAFYGPKIDFHLEDCLGRLHQCATIQLDMNFPERFDLTYVSSEGREERPVVIHRTVLGSLERFIGILIEHYAGRFPLWLAPVQVAVLSITRDQEDEALRYAGLLKEEGFRAEADVRSEKLGYKMREAETGKIPCILVVGSREVEEGTVSVRRGGGKDLGVMPFDRLLDLIREEVRQKS
jgi:threonyl-tRNA synthetase